ncbi:MAG: hypothetical protein ABIP49_07455 [Lysobacterales bacterium]
MSGTASLRFVYLSVILLAALIGCDRNPPKNAPATSGTPIPAATTPDADAAIAPLPSVPTDIVKAPPRKAPADRRPAQPPGANQPDNDDNDGGSREDYAEDPRDGVEERFDDSARRSLAVHWNGLGEIELGMGVDEVRDAWQVELDDSGAEESEACFYLSETMHRPASAPALMFEEGRLVRFDVDTPALGAPGGGRVGMEAIEILERYGEDNVERMPHKYTDGEYLRVESPDGDSVLLFETNEEDVVTEWRIGVEPQIDYVEGCS